ncbi:MAG: SURF1 family protein [Methyloligellaceae bacterium]
MKPTLVKLTLFAAAGVAMLIGLGTWQLQRLAWKQGLVERIEARARGGPVPLAAALRNWSQTGDIEYQRVRLSGVFDHDSERHLYTVVAGKPGWRIITPLKAGENAIVMVDRGYVPPSLKNPQDRAAGQVGGTVTVTGLARAPGRKNAFTPASDLARNIWYWRNLEGMAASVLDAGSRERLAPFFVEADAAATPGGWPKGGVTRVKFANRHLEYAVTWYGLAVALLIVYGAIVWRWRKYGEFT